MAVRRLSGDPRGGYEIALEYCKGCGLCVRECPTGAIALQEESK
jgi:Pyruvate/2-oxoacid:ferredoxin oxidoreductase delta subunit